MIKEIIPYGECGILILFEQVISEKVHHEVSLVYQQLKKSNFFSKASIIPAYCSITIQFQHIVVFEEVKKALENLPKITNHIQTGTIKLPVCYHSSFGIDLEEVTTKLDLSIEELIHLHCSKEYHVYMIGFTPGFPYLGSTNDRLKISRKETPRIHVPAGSVGLADNQTGIYPHTSPGGWQIIGRTPVQLFQAGSSTLLHFGDTVRFYPITKEEFERYA